MQGSEHKLAVHNAYHQRQQNNRAQAHHVQHRPLIRRWRCKFGIIGAHAHKPACSRNFGHRHELVLAFPFIAEGSTALCERVLNEFFLGVILKQQLFVHAVGNKTAALVDGKAVSAPPQPDGINGLFRKVRPAGAHGHSAEQCAVLAAHSFGRHIDQHIARCGFHDAFAQGYILAAEYLAGIIPISPVAPGQVAHIRIDPGNYTPLEVKKQK